MIYKHASELPCMCLNIKQLHPLTHAQFASLNSAQRLSPKKGASDKNSRPVQLRAPPLYIFDAPSHASAASQKCDGSVTARLGPSRRTRFRNLLDFTWISDFRLDFWISGFQSGFWILFEKLLFVILKILLMNNDVFSAHCHRHFTGFFLEMKFRGGNCLWGEKM